MDSFSPSRIGVFRRNHPLSSLSPEHQREDSTKVRLAHAKNQRGPTLCGFAWIGAGVLVWIRPLWSADVPPSSPPLVGYVELASVRPKFPIKRAHLAVGTRLSVVLAHGSTLLILRELAALQRMRMSGTSRLTPGFLAEHILR